jgi:hypothetical protein
MIRKQNQTRDGNRGGAVVYIGHREAVIVSRDEAGTESVEVLERAPHETEAGFDIRAVEEVEDEDRVVVSGPTFARTQFERAYVAMTRRPDRLVEVEPTSPKPAQRAG